ncbi:MAG: hypothetical protein LBH51_08545 [Treponema sp.]|jgi:hypothetical protein|nr:hypothetical protein [Treponema sp.]
MTGRQSNQPFPVWNMPHIEDRLGAFFCFAKKPGYPLQFPAPSGAGEFRSYPLRGRKPRPHGFRLRRAPPFPGCAGRDFGYGGCAQREIFSITDAASGGGKGQTGKNILKVKEQLKDQPSFRLSAILRVVSFSNGYK